MEIVDVFRSYGSEIDSYARWLGDGGQRMRDDFARRVQATPEESAAEALAWSFLRTHVEVFRAETRDRGGPDFGCRSAGEEFFVEATSILTETGTKKTGLPADIGKGGAYAPPFEMLRHKVDDKYRQVGRADGPIILAICVLNFTVGAVSFRPFPIELSMPLFYNREPSGVRVASVPSLSGVLLLGFGAEEVRAIGMLHPAAERPFCSNWLPSVGFCQFDPWPPTGDDTFRWVRGNPSRVYKP